jgi:hypothetical protein
VFNIIKFTVAKIWLFILAGMMWSGVGLMLCSLSFRWLVDLHSFYALWVGLFGLASSLVVYRFGFLRIAKKNINRLHTFMEKVSPFAFMPAKSYLLVVFMMALGIALRTSPIPKIYLSVLYTTIGAALFFSSLHYYPHVWVLASHPAKSAQ